MTLNEANASQLLVRYLLQEPDSLGQIPSREAAGEAAQYLAERSQERLQRGLTAAEVRRIWAAQRATR